MPHDFPLPLGGGLRARLERDGDRATLRLAGDFDLAGHDAFGALLREVEGGRAATIVIDLRALEFLDSTGMRALLAAHDRARESHALVLLDGAGPARRVLTMAGLDEVLTIVDAPGRLPVGPSPGAS